MSYFLVYEFTYCSFDEDIPEDILFLGLYKTREDAVKKGNERIKVGIEDFNVIVSKDLINRENPFIDTNSVEMCRDDEDGRTVYTINIKEFKVEGEKK